MHTRRTCVIVAVAVALTVASACSGGKKSGDSAHDPIVIGLDCDTTGPGAAYATPACTATKQTIDEINSQGGVLGGRKLSYVVGNDESDPTKTPTVIQKLVGKGAKALILLTSSAGALQSKSLIERTGIPVIMSVASNPLVTEKPANTYLYEL